MLRKCEELQFQIDGQEGLLKMIFKQKPEGSEKMSTHIYQGRMFRMEQLLQGPKQRHGAFVEISEAEGKSRK